MLFMQVKEKEKKSINRVKEIELINNENKLHNMSAEIVNDIINKF